MLDYLNGFNSRMSSIAIPYKLTQYCEKNIREYRRGKLSNELFYLYIHYVLLFIESKNIKRQVCTKEDIVQELQKLNKEYQVEIDTYELASDILNHCLENDGARLFFEDNTEQHSPYEIKLISGEYIMRNGSYLTNYIITPQGLNYIYATKEIAEVGRVTIEQIKLEKSIRSGNFVEARINVDGLLLAIQTQRKEIEQHIKMIKMDVLTIKSNDVIREATRTYDLIAQQQDDTKNILDLLKAYTNTDNAKQQSQKLKKGLQDIHYVEKNINLILTKQMELIGVIQDFFTTLDELLLDASFLSEANELNIMEDIIKPLENDISGIINPLEILFPILHSHKKKHFDINMLFERQLQIKEKEQEYVDVEEVDTDTVEINDEERVSKANELYEQIFVSILDLIPYDREISMKEILTKNPLLSKHILATKVVLASLLYEKEIIFDMECNYQIAGGITEEFYPGLAYKRSERDYSDLKLCIRTDTTEEIEIEQMNNDTLIKDVIKIPNMYLELKNV